MEVYLERIPFIGVSEKILAAFSMDPLGALASGSLIVCCDPSDADAILAAWAQAGIEGALIGNMTSSQDIILYRQGSRTPMPLFKADEITKAFTSC